MGIPASSQHPNQSEQRQQPTSWQGGPPGGVVEADRAAQARWRSLLAYGQERWLVNQGGFLVCSTQILTDQWLLSKLMQLTGEAESWSPAAMA
jgi:hypothetical protein